MPCKSDHLQYAINFAKYQSKRCKSDVEKRRMFDRFCVLANLYPKGLIQLVDDSPSGRTSDSTIVKEMSLDERAQQMLKELGGDDGDDAAKTSTRRTADSVPTN
jgi:hypothetical protein